MHVVLSFMTSVALRRKQRDVTLVLWSVLIASVQRSLPISAGSSEKMFDVELHVVGWLLNVLHPVIKSIHLLLISLNLLLLILRLFNSSVRSLIIRVLINFIAAKHLFSTRPKQKYALI